MSEPVEEYEHEDALSGAIHQIQGAISALNMEPEPIPEEEVDPEGTFLTDLDKWANHAEKHLNAALRIISTFKSELERRESEARVKEALMKAKNCSLEQLFSNTEWEE